MQLHATEPYDFGQSMRALCTAGPWADERACSDEHAVLGGYAGERPFVATLREGETAETLTADVEWLDREGDERVVADWLGAALSLADDVGPLYVAAADDPPFRRVLDTLDGYHQVRFSTPFGAACWAALALGTPVDVAREQKRELATSVGRVVDLPARTPQAHTGDGTPAKTPTGDESLLLFPTPRLLLTGAPAVGRLFDDRKAKTLLAAAETFATEPLSTLDTDELLDRLEAIWGFDSWAAEYVAIHGFGRMDRPPRYDPTFRRAVEELYGLPEATDTHLDSLAERYGRSAGYWAHYVTTWSQQRTETSTL